MEETIKNRIILILGILALIFFISNINSCDKLQRQKVARDQEMAKRLDLEENMNKSFQEKVNLQEELDSVRKELEDEKLASKDTKELLSKLQSENQTLTVELEKMTKLKEALEEDLKEALVGKRATTRPSR